MVPFASVTSTSTVGRPRESQMRQARTVRMADGLDKLMFLSGLLAEDDGDRVHTFASA
jgi:hypothetical protein